MDGKDLAERERQLKKAMANEEPPTVIKSLLALLQPWVATEDLLRQTKVGVTVNKLRQHSDPEIGRTASSLINKWKGEVKKTHKPAGSSQGTANAADAKASSFPSPSGTPKSEPVSKRQWQGNAEKRTASSDGVKFQLTDNETRDKCIELMYNGLCFMSYEPSEDIVLRARDIELAAYNVYQPETSAEYKTRLRSLFQNLKNKSNPGLRVNVLNGKITPERFVTMSHEDMKSDKRRAEDEKLQKENMDKAMVAQEERSISTSLTCGKCLQKQVSYSQAQTRSADEPMTTFCECINCSHRWKFS